MDNIIITTIGLCILGSFVFVYYEKLKISQYVDLLKELSEKEIGQCTKMFLNKEIVNIQYILKKNSQKHKSFPLLKELYLQDLEF